MNAYSRSVPDPAPIYRELYHKHGLGSLLDEAYVDEWHTARMERREGSVPWAAIVGIAAMLDMDPRTIAEIHMETGQVTVSYAVFNEAGSCEGVQTVSRPIETRKKF